MALNLELAQQVYADQQTPDQQKPARQQQQSGQLQNSGIDSDTTPSVANILQAYYYQNKYTASSSRLRNIEQSGAEKFIWSQRVLERNQDENNFAYRGAVGSIAYFPDTFQRILSPMFFDQLFQFGASTAGGLGIGYAGRAAGTFLGGLAGGLPGAAIGGTAGQYLGHLYGSAATYSLAEQARLKRVFKGAGMEYPEGSVPQTLTGAARALPEMLVGVPINSVMRRGWSGTVGKTEAWKNARGFSKKAQEKFRDMGINAASRYNFGHYWTKAEAAAGKVWSMVDIEGLATVWNDFWKSRDYAGLRKKASSFFEKFSANEFGDKFRKIIDKLGIKKLSGFDLDKLKSMGDSLLKKMKKAAKWAKKGVQEGDFSAEYADRESKKRYNMLDLMGLGAYKISLKPIDPETGKPATLDDGGFVKPEKPMPGAKLKGAEIEGGEPPDGVPPKGKQPPEDLAKTANEISGSTVGEVTSEPEGYTDPMAEMIDGYLSEKYGELPSEEPQIPARTDPVSQMIEEHLANLAPNLPGTASEVEVGKPSIPPELPKLSKAEIKKRAAYYRYLMGERKEPVFKFTFDNDKNIKSLEEVNDALIKGHIDLLEGKKTPAQKALYLFATALNVGDISDALNHMYLNNILLKDIITAAGGKKNWEVLFQTFAADTEAQNHFVRYIFGESNKIEQYDPTLKQLADNTKTLFNRHFLSRWHNLGVPIQLNENYNMPNNHDTEKIIMAGRQTFTEDMLKNIQLNWGLILDEDYVKKHGLEKSKLDFINAIYDSFVGQNSQDMLEFLGGGAANPLHRRVIYFNDATSWQKYMEKYGTSDNVFEIIRQAINSTARAQALVTQFGTNPAVTLEKLTTYLNSTPQDKVWGSLYKYGFNNLVNGFLAPTATMPWGKDWIMPKLIKFYRTANSIGLNLMTKNSIQYSAIEETMQHFFKEAFYNFEKETGKPFLNAFNDFATEIGDIIKGGKFTPEQEAALIDIALDYSIPHGMYPYSLSTNGLYDMPMWAKKTNAWISKIKQADDLSNYNKHRASISFQSGIGKSIGQSWESLSKEQRGLLEGGGITQAEWAYMAENHEKFIVSNETLADLFSMEDDRLRRVRLDLASYSKAMKHASETADPVLESVATKLAQIQNNYVRTVVSHSNQVATMSFAGKAANAPDLAGNLIRSFFSLRGYALDSFTRAMAKLDLAGHSATPDRFAAFFFQRMAIGLAVSCIRWGLVGRRPELASMEDWMKLFGDAMGRGDVFPFSLLSELFSDYYHTAGNSFMQNTAQFAGRTLGAGLMYSMDKASTTLDLIRAMSNHDNVKAFKAMRRLNPGGDWLPADFMLNRIIMDNAFRYIDKEAAYALFDKEVKINNKQHFRYFVAPGDLAGYDALGRTGLASEQWAMYKETSAARKAGETHVLLTAREAANSNIKNIRKTMKDNPAKMESQIMFEQAKLNLEVAKYYKKHKLPTVSKSQVKRTYAKAKMEYEESKKIARNTP